MYDKVLPLWTTDESISSNLQQDLNSEIGGLRLKSLTAPDLLNLSSLQRSRSKLPPQSSGLSSVIKLSKSQILYPDQTPGGVFVGVSLGGKSPMVNADNIEAILDVLSARGYQEVTFLVADDIAQFNYHVFDTCSLGSGAALKGARLEGDSLCELIKSVSALCPYLSRVRVCRWRDINTDKLTSMIEVLEKVGVHY